MNEPTNRNPLIAENNQAQTLSNVENVLQFISVAEVGEIGMADGPSAGLNNLIECCIGALRHEGARASSQPGAAAQPPAYSDGGSGVGDTSQDPGAAAPGRCASLLEVADLLRRAHDSLANPCPDLDNDPFRANPHQTAKLVAAATALVDAAAYDLLRASERQEADT